MIPYSGNPNGRYNTVIGVNPLKISLYLPLGVAGRGRPHLKFLALVIPYSGMPPLLSPFGVAGRGKVPHKIGIIGTSILWEPQGKI